jgi:hypothetical protein
MKFRGPTLGHRRMLLDKGSARRSKCSSAMESSKREKHTHGIEFATIVILLLGGQVFLSSECGLTAKDEIFFILPKLIQSHIIRFDGKDSQNDE